MKFIYNSWDKKHKAPFGAVKCGGVVSFTVESDADCVYLLGFGDKRELTKQEEKFTINVEAPAEPGILSYNFEVVKSSHSEFYGMSEEGGWAAKDSKPYQLTVHSNTDNAAWFKNCVIYQIYVDRFYNGISNETKLRENVLVHSSWNDKPVYIKNEKGEIVLWDFYGGNIDGVIQKLSYIKSLGTNVIYLNPIFESPSNHKYDTSDYNTIDRMYGTEETLKRLVDEAGKLDMKIMLDGVFSHTGDDSIFFNKYKTYGEGGAYNDTSSKYYNWYNFEEYPDKYDCWWGVTSLPNVNEMEPSYIDYLMNENYGAVIKWMKLGIAGWRLDVADELPDEFIKKLKDAIVKVNPEAVLLGEVWEDASNKISYDAQRKYILEDSLNSVSNYPLRDNIIALLLGHIVPSEFGSAIMRLQENYPPNVFYSLMNLTGTHDTTRLFTLLGEAPQPESMSIWQQRDYAISDDAAKIALGRLALYFVIIFTLPGNPCIYYGDEICLQGYKDPYNRGTFDWESENKIIVELVKKLSALKKEIISDDVHLSFIDGDGALAYKLSGKKGEYLVYINQTENAKEITAQNILFSYKSDIKNSTVEISSLGAAVIKIN